MSGIAGIFNLDGRPAERATVERMLGAIPYRARDGASVWSEGRVALGHAMLHTTPESLHEHQPLLDETGQFCLTLDGRVDNREELRDALLAAEVRLRDDTDAELVLRAYQAWGEDAPRRILGDFAFVIWDGPRRRLFCARDWVGVSAFYYFSDARTFICGSELQQLFEDPRVPREPNEGMVGEYLCVMPTSLEETLYRGVMRLAPAHIMIVDSAGVKMRRYYAPDPARVLRLADDREYAEQFKSLLFESVRCRLRSSGRVISDLSGGLDSSSITCVAQSILRERGAAAPPLEAVSIMFAEAEADERAYATSVAEKSGVTWVKLPPRTRTAAEMLEEVVHYRDVPDPPNAAMAEFRELLRDRGDIRVWLTGQGGDQILGDSTLAYAELMQQFRVGALIRSLANDFRRRRRDGGGKSPLHELALSAVMLLPDSARRSIPGWIRGISLPMAIDRDFARKINLAERLRRHQPEPRFRRAAAIDVYRSCSYGRLVHPLELVDRWSGRAQVQTRHPLLDRRLFEFALSIPVAQRWRDGIAKIVLREAMSGLLPEDVRLRTTKACFDSMMAQVLLQLGNRFFESLAIASNGWVDSTWVIEAYRRFARMHSARDPDYWILLFDLWRVAGLELWFSGISRDAECRLPQSPGAMAS
jgi:asparagine synthase (glutamine-hydrolysing)